MISPFAGFTIVVVASKKLPVKSLKELIDYAKANPGSSTTARSASAARSIWPANISRRSPASRSPTCPIATSRNTAPT